jgi:hypothetical protein
MFSGDKVSYQYTVHSLQYRGVLGEREGDYVVNRVNVIVFTLPPDPLSKRCIQILSRFICLERGNIIRGAGAPLKHPV